MTNSLSEMLGEDPNVRTFFALPYPWTDQSLKDNDARLVLCALWDTLHTAHVG